MVTDPIHDHPPWARVLVAVSVGECTEKAESEKEREFEVPPRLWNGADVAGGLL